MPFKLTRAEQQQLQELARAVEKAAGELDDAVRVANEKAAEAAEELNDAIRRFNDARAAAETFVDEHASQWRDEYEERSDGWREGERGEAADTFVCEWESVDLSEVDEVSALDFEIDSDYADMADALLNLPQEVDQ